MKTGLLSIFAVAISAVLTSGTLYAGEPATSNAGAVQAADSPVDAEPAPAAAVPASPAADQVTVEEAEGAEAAIEIEAAAGADSAVAAIEDAAVAPEPTDSGAEIADAAVAPEPADSGAEIADAAVAPEPADSGAEIADAAVAPEPADSDAEIADAQALEATNSEPVSEVANADAQATPKITLGKIGYDEQGRSGRIHVVVSGDTLWDISDAYLGTPWVWPSVWTDNRDIENPHVIVPGDRIWISAYEMRRVSAEEAERLLSGQPRTADAESEASGPASDSFQSLLEDEGPSNIVRVSTLETTGLVSAEQLEAAASIVDSVSERVMLSQGDRVYLGLGDQKASVGDEFTVFRAREKVFDPDTNRLLGYHVEVLGWVVVEETDAEASLALVRMSAGNMVIGDRIMPRERPVLDVEVVSSPKNVDGQISFFPSSRVLMGSTDFVYLNRGELDGLEVGSPLEVYRAGWNAPEPARDTRVEVPDRVIADLLVVRARRESSVALVRHAETELQLGDHFRGASE